MANTPPNWIAREDIAPSRFIIADGSNFGANQATDNDVIVGISMEGTNKPPIPEVTTQLAAEEGESFQAYGDGESTVLLELGGTVVAGNLLKADSLGRGVAIATSGTVLQNHGALAQEGGAVGELIQVQVQLGSKRINAAS